MKKVGILGGTFDPPHIGHLIIAEEVRRALALEEIWFIPSYEPPHKAKATIDAKTRLNMLSLSIEDNRSFKVNPIEIQRQEKSYTIHTMKILTEQNPQIKFYFIIGADMVEYLPNWYKIDELIELVTFVGVGREGYSIESSYPVVPVEIPMINISSSMLRERLQKGESAKYLIPEQVYRYIKEHRLYEG